MYKEKRNLLLSIFLFLQIGVVSVLSKYPEWVDAYYANGLYPELSAFLRAVFGPVPFSVGDLIYLLLILLLFRFVYLFIRNRRGNRRSLVLSFLAALSIIHFFFYLNWGLNYSQSPLRIRMTLPEQQYDLQRLQEVTGKLIERTRELQTGLSGHDSLPVQVPYSKTEILELTRAGYEALAKRFPKFHYNPVSIKKSLFSLPLTYMGFSGYLNPLTGEAQVDDLIPGISFPMTSSHEVAHQLGIASENEANFIGFLAAAHHSDPYFNYSAHLFILRYALFDLHRMDIEAYESYKSKLSPGMLENFRESDEFWKAYENPAEPLFKWFYDRYLKLNQQHDGLQSYNKVMELLLSYEQVHALEFN